jgi:hypothetical protein
MNLTSIRASDARSGAGSWIIAAALASVLTPLVCRGADWQKNSQRGNFTHWGHDFYTMFRASAGGVATTSISPFRSVTSTRTVSFRRSQKTSTEPVLV